MNLSIEDLDQDGLDTLCDMADQRAAIAACLVGVMESEATSDDALKMKRKMMHGFIMGLMMGFRINDSIEEAILKSMAEHCKEEIELHDLLKTL